MFKISKINYGCFKAVKLVGNVIIVINGVPTIYLWKKNEEKRLILSEISELNVARNHWTGSMKYFTSYGTIA